MNRINIHFHATIIPLPHVLGATLHYLAKRNHSTSNDRDHCFDAAAAAEVALLVESNTGYGQSFAHLREEKEKEKEKEKEILKLYFPLHIAGLRLNTTRRGAGGKSS